MLANIRGFGGRRARRIGLLVIGDLALQLLIVVLGLALFFNPHTLLDPIHLGSAPTWSTFVFALTITAIAFTSLESAAGPGRRGADQPRRPAPDGRAAGPRRSCSGYVGIAVVAVTALPVHGRSHRAGQAAT